MSVQSLKELHQAVKAATSELLGDDSTSITSDAEGLLLIAMAAVRECQGSLSGSSESSAASDELKGVRKTLKRLRQELLSASTSQATTGPSSSKRLRTEDEEDASLGQYAGQKSDLFGGNNAKQDKFARLMGGGKSKTAAHNTFAASSSEIKKINANLEREFQNALQHKARKGLGA